MKQRNKAISFILTITLFFSLIITAGTSYGAEATEPTGQSSTVLSDISGHWGESDIKNAVIAGFVKGYQDGTFKPNKAVTRAEFITMVNKALQLRDKNTVNILFRDVKATDWYYKEIQKASYAEYVNGISDTSFMPDKNITREEAAVMLAGFLPEAGHQEAATLNVYPDAGQISSWAKEAMAAVINKGYLAGYAKGNLAPKGNLTRAEAAKILGKILDKETIVREDVSVENTGEILKDKIYVGDITIEKSVGEGEASLENLSALSRVYVKGGGTNTVTIRNSTVIQIIICKEGTKVRVLSEDSTIYEALVFNGNLLVDSKGQSAETGENGYESIIYLKDTVTADTAVRIAAEIATRTDNTGKVTQEQVQQGASAVVAGAAVAVNDDGSFNISVPNPPETTGSHGHHNGGGLTVNGLPATLSTIQGDTCTCGLPLASEGAFQHVVGFDPDGIAEGGTVTGYAIYTESQLQHLAMHLNANAVLMNDLDFSNITTGSAVSSTPMGGLKIASEAGLYTKGHDVSNFENGNFVPIGNYQYSNGYPYTGIFCGNGKNITGLIISGNASCVGLFGSTSGAAIKDLTLSNGLVSGGYYAGSVVGFSHYGTNISDISNTGTVNGTAYLGGVVGTNYHGGTISNCSNTGAVSGGYCVGGVIGYKVEDGTVDNSFNTGTITGGNEVGGVVGCSEYGTVSSCYNTGAVNGSIDVGGIIGANSGSVSNSYNTGAVSGTNGHSGGIAGYNAGPINNNYNTGAVNGSGNAGGVAGVNEFIWAVVSNSYNTGAVNGLYSGGLVGLNINNGSVSNSYNTGAVTGSDSVGGAVGYNYEGVISAYWMDKSNLENTGGIGYGSGETATFSAIDSTFSAIYASMSAIASNADGDETGAINSITFSSDSAISDVFKTLQGSYIFSQSNPTFTLYKISDDVTVTVTTGTSLGALLTSSEGGIIPSDASNGSTFSLSEMTSGTWILIKAVDSENLRLNRIYTIYIK